MIDFFKKSSNMSLKNSGVYSSCEKHLSVESKQGKKEYSYCFANLFQCEA